MLTVQTFTSIINQLLPEPHAGLLNGILFGTKATISKELTDALITTGTLHIVALSGMNITILTGLISSTLLWVVGRRGASFFTILLIAGFVWFVGASPSIVRAGIMGSISLIAVIFGKQYWGLLTWILAVGIMLLLNPGWTSDISFQLSAGATLGIILFGGQAASLVNENFDPSSEKLVSKSSDSRTPKSEAGQNFVGSTQPFVATGMPPRPLLLFWKLIKEDLQLTLAAQVFTIPLIFLYFHRISLISPVANVAIGWLIPLLTVAGLLAAIAGWVWLPLGILFAWASWVGLEYLILVINLLSKVPGASIGW